MALSIIAAMNRIQNPPFRNTVVSIGELVETILAVTGKKARIITEEQRLRPDKSEVERLLCDNALAKKITPWRPQYSLEQGLEITSRWVKENMIFFNSESYVI